MEQALGRASAQRKRLRLRIPLTDPHTEVKQSGDARSLEDERGERDDANGRANETTPRSFPSLGAFTVTRKSRVMPTLWRQASHGSPSIARVPPPAPGPLTA